jgi:hypothetical protein
MPETEEEFDARMQAELEASAAAGNRDAIHLLLLDEFFDQQERAQEERWRNLWAEFHRRQAAGEEIRCVVEWRE